MADGVSQIQCFAYILLERVFLDDAFLDRNGSENQFEHFFPMNVRQLKSKQFFPIELGVNECMLNHFGISRKDVFRLKRREKCGSNNYIFRRIKSADFVFQSHKIDAGFSAYGRIHRSENSGGYIDVFNSAFKRGCRKSTQVGNHSSAQID